MFKESLGVLKRPLNVTVFALLITGELLKIRIFYIGMLLLVWDLGDGQEGKVVAEQGCVCVSR